MNERGLPAHIPCRLSILIMSLAACPHMVSEPSLCLCTVAAFLLPPLTMRTGLDSGYISPATKGAQSFLFMSTNSDYVWIAVCSGSSQRHMQHRAGEQTLMATTMPEAWRPRCTTPKDPWPMRSPTKYPALKGLKVKGTGREIPTTTGTWGHRAKCPVNCGPRRLLSLLATSFFCSRGLRGGNARLPG